ncbi:MAG: hypothetical protein ABI887_02660 [Burkholderiales bacterium]
MSAGANPSKPPTAVIVVHGVADQVRGETAAAVAAQLAHARRGRVQRSALPIEVPHLLPASGYARWEATGIGGVVKSLRQSRGSDFLEPDLGGDPRHRTAAAPLPNSAGGTAPNSGPTADEGVRYTDYLLAKARAVPSQGPSPAVYEAPCFEVQAGDGTRLDVFEMHWADLSRLSSSAPRIVSELFTLLFHLSKLGADAVGLAATTFPKNRPLQWLNFFQRNADWLYSRWLALVSLQLVVCALLVLPRGVLAGHALGSLAAGLLAVLSVVVAALWVYRGKASWLKASLACIVPGVLAAIALVWLVGSHWPTAAPWLMAAWIVVIVVLHDGLLRFCERRFRAVLGIGRLLLALTLALVLWGGQLFGMNNWDGWALGVLNAVEGLLLGQVALWMLITPLIVGIVVAGMLAGRAARPRSAKDDATTTVQQAVVTGRLGLFVSLGIFLAFTMTAWTMFAAPLKSLAADLHYTPWWFGSTTMPAAEFVQQRLVNSTENFAPVALALLVLLGFIALSFLPSLLIEVRAVEGVQSARLGRWLTLGNRAIERLACWWSWLLLPLLLVAALVLAASQWQQWADHQTCTTAERAAASDGNCIAAITTQVHALTDPLLESWSSTQSTSNKALASLVLALSGGAAGLIAIGGMAFKKVRALRAPLDAALDVDNHFREFPRDAISRVQIVERYVALLERVITAGHTEIAIVSHSQGTVITADLLRYLQQRERLLRPGQAAGDALVALGARLRGHVRLLTVGSPLRQLYALRFPVMYGWVLGNVNGPHRGPSPAALGAVRWINLWGSGDYVGRWLWASAGGAQPTALQFPEEDYAPTLRSHDGWRDQCIGADAHTHYFELGQAAVTVALALLTAA